MLSLWAIFQPKNTQEDGNNPTTNLLITYTHRKYLLMQQYDIQQCSITIQSYLLSIVSLEIIEIDSLDQNSENAHQIL